MDIGPYDHKAPLTIMAPGCTEFSNIQSKMCTNVVGIEEILLQRRHKVLHVPGMKNGGTYMSTKMG